jgi:predicted transcriptional regulator of viral defense system
MTLIEAQKRLLALNLAVISTRDVSACLQIKQSHASKILDRLAKGGVIKKIVRGLWIFSGHHDPFILPEAITNPYPSYISLQTALYFHGMISQIPETIYVVSLARTRKYKTPLGVFSIHHFTPDLFFGYENINETFIKIATPEKALFDFLYLSKAGSLFHKLPELEFPKKFKKNKMIEMIQQVPSLRLRTMMQLKWESLLKKI